MKKNPSRNSGLTLMEILVSAIIIALVLVGLANTFILGRRYIVRGRSRMAGGELGKLFLEPLKMDVRQDEWDSLNNDYLGTNDLSKKTDTAGAPQTINQIVYTPRYTVDVPPGYPADSQMRRVRVDVTWTENEE